MERVQDAEQTVEVFENEIQMYLSMFCESNAIESEYDILPSQWNAALSYIYKHVIKPNPDILTIGYSSFKLDYVVKWLNDYFEFYGEAKVSCDDNGWIPVQGRLPEDNHKGIYDMQLVTLEDGEVCMGVYNNREKEWWTRKQEGERWYTNKHNVIAWQPLPEPYKEEKKC